MTRKSRGCRECRQRRIGCDGGVPACRQCTVTNRQCSGPVKGAIIFDQSRALAARFGKDSSSAPRSDGGLVVCREPAGSSLAITIVPRFVSFLTLASNRPSKLPWLCRLDDISLGERGSALGLSLDAVATVYFGVTNKDPSAVMEARRMYGAAISRQYLEVHQDSGVPSTGTICAATVLSLFESMLPTSIEAYSGHLSAARNMLRLVCKDFCRNLLLRQVAMHVRYQSASRPRTHIVSYIY
jgi:hypothetical protein